MTKTTIIIVVKLSHFAEQFAEFGNFMPTPDVVVIKCCHVCNPVLQDLAKSVCDDDKD